MKIADRKSAIAFTFFMALAGGLGLAQHALAQDADLKVSNSEAMKAATAKVQPDYPAIAKQLHLEGGLHCPGLLMQSSRGLCPSISLM